MNNNDFHEHMERVIKWSKGKSMNNNDLRAKIQAVLDEREQERLQRKKLTITEYVDAVDAIAFDKIKQILAAKPFEEFLDTLLDYKQKGYTYLKQINFFPRQIHATINNEATGYTFTSNYNLQANESFSDISKQIVDAFYNNP
jgi:hypothetical protein